MTRLCTRHSPGVLAFGLALALSGCSGGSDGSEREGTATARLTYLDKTSIPEDPAEMVFEQTLEAPREELRPISRPVGIGVVGISVQVSELRVLRDLHYLDPLGLGRAWSAEQRLAAGEYFVLGDNGPVSRDSRYWEPGSVTSKTLLGRVLRLNGLSSRL